MKRYKVFFENRFIMVSPEPDRLQNYTLFHRYHNETELYEAISSFEDGNALSMNIFDSNIDDLWKTFTAYFRYVEAAGGLVRHGSGHFLFILRKGKWDLPKGHMEAGESAEACALREVEEECGVSGHRIVCRLFPSYHTWKYEGVSYLKETHWFLMDYKGELTARPQESEGITEATWLRPDSVSIIRQSAWDSLIDLINASILR